MVVTRKNSCTANALKILLHAAVHILILPMTHFVPFILLK
jgi:hypothetical protein